MSGLLNSQDFFMKSLGFVLLFGFISLGAIGGCNDGSEGNNNQALLTENDFTASHSGLVITSQFIPHLMRSLDLLNYDGTMDEDASLICVAALHFAARGDITIYLDKEDLAIEKVLCGLSPEEPDPIGIVLTEEEKTLTTLMLTTIISHWSAIGETSVDLLRETFLIRDGQLVQKEEYKELRVERKNIDILVDQIPWNISPIYYSWMPEPLHVVW